MAPAETAGIESVLGACSSCEWVGMSESAMWRPEKKDAAAEVVLLVAVEAMLAPDDRTAFEPVADEMLDLRLCDASRVASNRAGSWTGGEKRWVGPSWERRRRAGGRRVAMSSSDCSRRGGALGCSGSSIGASGVLGPPDG